MGFFNFLTGRPKDGPVKTYHFNGSLDRDGTIKNGKWDGLCRRYYETSYGPIGDIRDEVVFKDGKMNGPVTMYHSDRRVELEGTYKNDKRDGIWKHYDLNGELCTEFTYKDGELIETKEY